MEPRKAAFERVLPNPKARLLDQVREVCRLMNLPSHSSVTRSWWHPLPAGEGGVRESGCEVFEITNTALAQVAFLPHPFPLPLGENQRPANYRDFGPSTRAGDFQSPRGGWPAPGRLELLLPKDGDWKSPAQGHG